jgi:hypothetical protein
MMPTISDRPLLNFVVAVERDGQAVEKACDGRWTDVASTPKGEAGGRLCTMFGVVVYEWRLISSQDP